MVNSAKKPVISFTNTLGRALEEFIPINSKEVGMYTCGPTVYGRAHIGNLRAYVFADVTRRVLEYSGYKVKQVMNITDVGHLTSDADSGEDKLQKVARAQKETAWDVAKRYTEIFLKDIDAMNIQHPSVICKATDHIKEQIALVKRLEENGFIYLTSDGVYFDTSKFPRYSELAKLNIEGLEGGKRISLGEKKNKTDFALWKFSSPEDKRDMEWDSPWGRGFPGWHIECSAMSMKYLGETFDIHTGGIDHIPIHHTNEIAQSECATGKKFVNYWLHCEFLNMSGNEKMSKSLGNVVNLSTLSENNIEPLAYRYLCLRAHYRSMMLYDLEILKDAANTFSRLRNKVISLKSEENAKEVPLAKLSDGAKKYLEEFRAGVFNDLNTPQGLAVMWNMLRDEKIKADEKYTLLLDFDNVLGLKIKDMKEESAKDFPEDIKEMLKERNKLRSEKKWKEADEVRGKLLKSGYEINDGPQGSKLKKI